MVRSGRRAGADEFALNLDAAEDQDASGADHRYPAKTVPIWHRPVLWLLCGGVLIATGVLTAPVPPGPPFGIIDNVVEPVHQWQVDLGYDGMPEDGEEGVVPTPEVWLAGGRVLYVEPDQVTALDAADGSALWQSTGTDLRCELNEPVLLCVSGYAEDAELVHLHLEQGEVARGSEPDLVGVIPHRGDVITLHATGAGVAAARRAGGDGLASGDGQVWSTPLNADPLWPDDVPAEDRDPYVALDIAGDQVMVLVTAHIVSSDGATTHSGTAGGVLDAATGEPQDLGGAEPIGPISSGLDTHWLLSDSEYEPVARIDTDGERHRARGFGETVLLVDDGAHAGLDLERGETLRAFSTRTGRTAWEHAPGENGLAWPVARLDEVLVVTAHDSMLGLDLNTGEELWASTGQARMTGYSDGEVLVVVASRNGSATFIGLEARSGAERFEVKIGGSWVTSFDMDGRRAVTLTTEGLSLWQIG
ncbi:MAG TPA: PQQ-binding-like beta-propeller repeat protein [Beutenbergiaceae bacterium]|nr:PQQ-binding-like beta-propeller repeat protein [Beutenbergiaceae bacterium]